MNSNIVKPPKYLSFGKRVLDIIHTKLRHHCILKSDLHRCNIVKVFMWLFRRCIPHIYVCKKSQDETPPFRENWKAPFSRLNGRYISVTIQWPFSAIQSTFRRISAIFTFFSFRIWLILYTLFRHIFDSGSHEIMSECNTHIWYFKDCRNNCLNREWNEIIQMRFKNNNNGWFSSFKLNVFERQFMI